MKTELIKEFTNVFLRHSELVSESINSENETLKRVQGDEVINRMVTLLTSSF